jgi:uncharacterized protein with PIN domain
VKRAESARVFTLRFVFHGDLPVFVRPKRSARQIVRQLCEKTSVKDAIEACGVPHPEVDLILVDGGPVNFSYQLETGAMIDAFPVTGAPKLFPEDRLQRRSLTKFVADGHLGKLARDLRLLGIDVAYDKDANDSQLVATATNEGRALLTRDRRLLMHSVVRDGYYPRSQIAEAQAIEVVGRFALGPALAPFTRCLHCNAGLTRVAKEEIINELEPLTRIYYEDFHRCPRCGQIYWAGSHFQKLQARIEKIRCGLSS